MTPSVALRLAAVGLFGFTMVLPPLTATLAALGGIAISILSLGRPAGGIRSRTVRLAVAGLGALVFLMGIYVGALGLPEPAGVMPLVVSLSVLSMIALIVFGGAAARVALVVGVLLFVVTSVEVIATFGGNGYGLDVYRSHEAAADAVRDGQNPYTDAVKVLDGSPVAEPGAVIEGYAYPPVTLVGYVTADLVGGDPRLASVLAVVGLVGGVAWRLREKAEAAASVLMLLAAVPLQRAIVWSGWTEPVSLALLTAGVVLWRREWLSPVLIGLALASKQYLVVLVPLLFLIDTRPWRRSIVAVGVAALSLVPAAVADFSAFWSTMVTRPLGIGFRPDTRSLSGALSELGFSVEIPTWMMIGLVIALSVWLAARLHTTSGLFAGMAVVLAATFVLSLAFTNYWWLVQWLVAFSVVVKASDQDPTIRTAA